MRQRCGPGRVAAWGAKPDGVDPGAATPCSGQRARYQASAEQASTSGDELTLSRQRGLCVEERFSAAAGDKPQSPQAFAAGIGNAGLPLAAGGRRRNVSASPAGLSTAGCRHLANVRQAGRK